MRPRMLSCFPGRLGTPVRIACPLAYLFPRGCNSRPVAPAKPASSRTVPRHVLLAGGLASVGRGTHGCPMIHRSRPRDREGPTLPAASVTRPRAGAPSSGHGRRRVAGLIGGGLIIYEACFVHSLKLYPGLAARSL
jgi:hypothetical protein